MSLMRRWWPSAEEERAQVEAIERERERERQDYAQFVKSPGCARFMEWIEQQIEDSDRLDFSDQQSMLVQSGVRSGLRTVLARLKALERGARS